ncbi:tetratricopeptide repeat protein [Lentilactobacillus senioris]|uniref:Tetratricopeptide repeat family protein n=1 Tax=Lentilactobacillus senioris DSM 24302 = JCM 17472 TaxID=1423802 RepID=A0A0R2CVV6_9LACO|nr:tetratricopeptide repeat protein [Lentilactobacillus senioris]KRM93812.1 tetratricopeptide repeat family protein [Lentilactobacillus senioris DSM 24302 = JCM 17472]
MSYSAEALDQLEAGQLDKFQENFALALKNDDDDLLFSLAEELYSLGFTDNAKQIYEQLLAKYPDEGQLKIQLAELAIDDQNDELALEYLTTITKDDSDYVQALLVEADLYQTQELFEISEQKLLEARAIAPDEPVIDFALGEFYFATRNFNKAISIYLKLIKAGTLEVAGVNLVQRIGVAYAQSGKFEQALGYLTQIKPVDMNPDTRFELAFTQFNLHDYVAAIKNFEELRENDPQYSSLYPYLADAYVQQNENAAALRTIQEGLGVDQYNEQLWLKAANIAQLVGDDELVQEYLNQGLAIDPENLAIITQLANWQIKHDHFQEVVDLLAPLQEEEQFDAVLAWNLATANSHLGNVKAAQHNYELASAELSNDSDFLKEAGLFYRSLGKPEIAHDYFKRYLTLVPSDFEIEMLLDEDL